MEQQMWSCLLAVLWFLADQCNSVTCRNMSSLVKEEIDLLSVTGILTRQWGYCAYLVYINSKHQILNNLVNKWKCFVCHEWKLAYLPYCSVYSLIWTLEILEKGSGGPICGPFDLRNSQDSRVVKPHITDSPASNSSPCWNHLYYCLAHFSLLFDNGVSLTHLPPTVHPAETTYTIA